MIGEVPTQSHEAIVEGNVVHLHPTPCSTVAWGDIHVAFLGSAVAVTGDAYDWVFSWGNGGPDVLPDIPRFGEHYILGKLAASSTRCNAYEIDKDATLEAFRQYERSERHIDEVRLGLVDCYTVEDAQRMVMQLDAAGDEDYELVARKPSPQVLVAVRAVKMAAEAALRASGVPQPDAENADVESSTGAV